MRRSSAYPWTYLESLWAGTRARRQYDSVRVYTMFIGQPRSGTSLVGSLLNAHRHMWIAQELNALRYVRRGYGRNQLYWLLQMKDKEFDDGGRRWTGYDYRVDGQWQGRCEQLYVIGDKKAGLSSEQLTQYPELLVRLQHLVQVPIRIVHVIRNPYNVIATIHQKRNRTSLELAADMFFRRCLTNWQLMQQRPDQVLTFRLESLIEKPTHYLPMLCRFLDVQAEPAYIEACSRLLFSKPRQSQLNVRWTSGLIGSIEQRISQFPFLRDYHFDGQRAA